MLEPPTGQPALQLAAGPLDQEPGRPPGHPPAPALPVQPGAIGRPATAHDGGLDVQGLEAVCQAVVPRISAHAYAALRGELLALGVIHVAELSLEDWVRCARCHLGSPSSCADSCRRSAERLRGWPTCAGDGPGDKMPLCATR